MLKIYVNLVKPLINRLGTAGAAVLITHGADADTAAQFVNALVAAGLIGIDLILSWRDNKGAAHDR